MAILLANEPLPPECPERLVPRLLADMLQPGEELLHRALSRMERALRRNPTAQAMGVDLLNYCAVQCLENLGFHQPNQAQIGCIEQMLAVFWQQAHAKNEESIAC